MKRRVSYLFVFFANVLTILGQATHIQDCKKLTSCAVTNQQWTRPNNVTVYGKRVYSTFIKCSTNTNVGGQEETCINHDPLDACQKTDCDYTCERDLTSRKKEITGITSSFEDCEEVLHIGGYDCRTCLPAPTPTPNAGACGGIADFTTFPTTGCSSGLTLVGSWCDLSLAEQSYCNGPTFYDFDSCSCPDGSWTPPPPGSCNQPSDHVLYPSTGCVSGLVDHNGVCEKSYSFQGNCADPTGYEPTSCSCPDGYNPSPIIVDVDESGFTLTSAANGVDFDILAVGSPLRIAWTASGSTNAFLVLDRNGNGTIDTGEELFGNITPQPDIPNPNGFLALAEYDTVDGAGNGDGVITPSDSIFNSLQLWQDTNHNGISESWELHSLRSLGLQKIDLDYHLSRRTDQFGNRFRYRARVRNASGAQRGWAWDVFLKADCD